ncbi:MAG TPA: HNH endonuclease [Candidatus Baltobacteraceae bacterium]|nr:HNH endonuclease [Candidatus Baltobacteraceae bacterium]
MIETYDKRCAVTGERSLPALEAAHIKPFTLTMEHSVSNGLLMRADIHKLFDKGYVTVRPDATFRVSRSLRDDFSNGRIYYELDGLTIREPNDPADRPLKDYLDWHYSTVFKG